MPALSSRRTKVPQTDTSGDEAGRASREESIWTSGNDPARVRCRNVWPGWPSGRNPQLRTRARATRPLMMPVRGRPSYLLPNSRSEDRMSENTETAILAGGCFWPAQELLRHRTESSPPAPATPAGRTTTRPPTIIRVTPRRSRSRSIPREPPTGPFSSSSSRSTGPTLAKSWSAPTTVPRSSIPATSSAKSPWTRLPTPAPPACGPARS